MGLTEWEKNKTGGLKGLKCCFNGQVYYALFLKKWMATNICDFEH